MSNHTAIILIALGGPRTLDEIGPFMSAFIGRPAPLPVVAAVTDRYKQIGGRSPLPELVRAQAKALEQELGNGFRVYEGFRYSNPAIAAAVDQAVRDGADRVVGLSLSPYATQVTTGAYKNAFELPASGNVRKTFIASWHDNPLFVKAWEEKVFDGLKRFRTGEQKHAVVVFTSHSIPKRYIDAGDPYQRQVEETVRMIVQNLGIAHWRLAWQSKGVRATEPWLEPEVEPTLDELSRAGYRAVLEVPVGFTCDHLETLYDIDIVHRAHAKKLGITFERAASLNASTLFIKALADVARKAS
jgi:ferrochelatase